MAKKGMQNIPQDSVKLYEAAIASVPEMELKTNFGFPYTSLNGNMYTLLSKNGKVGVRLPKKEREEFLEKYNSTLYKAEPGPLLKEYVTIPESMLSNLTELRPYLELSYHYACKLKPKKKK